MNNKRQLLNFINLLKINSFVFAGPISSFLVILILAKLSHLASDRVYFLVLSFLAFSSLADGGLSFNLNYLSSNNDRAHVIKKVVKNLQLFALAIPICLTFMLSNTANSLESPIELICILFTSGFTSIFKVLSDTFRFIGMKTLHRNFIDVASSALSITRVIFAYLFVNIVPFLYTYTVLVFFELLFLAYILRDKVQINSLRVLFSEQSFKLHFNSAYVLANIGYIVGFNIDRLVSFYVLSNIEYRNLVIITSLLNMSIIPNKLIENLRIFPTDYAHSQTSDRVLMYILPVFGILLFITGLSIFYPLTTNHDRLVISIISVIWIPLTIYYNNLWALHLQKGGSIDFAKITLLSGTIATAIAIIFSALHPWAAPIGLFSYSLFNAVFAYGLSKK